VLVVTLPEDSVQESSIRLFSRISYIHVHASVDWRAGFLCLYRSTRVGLVYSLAHDPVREERFVS
jgi:hypothetical protein